MLAGVHRFRQFSEGGIFCIDKSSSAQLSEAINSMFRWYRDAAKCYVYLSDVSASITGNAGNSVAFLESRWFTRGWTLQELLAPPCVEFFSVEGDLLGNKQSRVQEISKVTNIAAEALEGTALFRFSVEERMAWAKERRTTREEDRAYSLLGIFDIHMPLIYGEGEEKALKRLQKEIRESSGDAAAILLQTTETNSSTRNARLSKIQEWISAPDPSTNYQKALKQRQHNTGLWFLEGERYASWKIEAASCLWLYGIPGCGKTILSSTILQDLFQHRNNNPGHAVAYFYFDFNDMQKQQAELMLRSLVCQLSWQAVDIPASLDALFTSHEDGSRQLSLDALLQVARQTMQQLPQVYIMLDALDECGQRTELMEMLEAMAGWQLPNVHLMVTSRRERDIESSLEGFVDPCNSICLQSEEVDKDIQQYVRQKLSDKGLSKWGKDATLRHEIESALMQGSKGMFRWAVCQLDTLGKCRNRAMLRKALAALPPTLDKTYDRILCAIAEEDVEYAIRVLLWLAFSDRPLSVDEVAEVVAIDVARDPAFDREEVLEDPLEALDICSSLITITSNNDDERLQSTGEVVVLAHYSVKEYLISDRIQRGQAARYSMQAAVCHSIIARACLGYLGQFQQPESMTEDMLGECKLARYSAELWASHAQKSGDRAAETSQAALQLLSRDNAAYLNWIQIHDPDKPWSESDFERVIEEIPNPLYYATLFGLGEVMKLLLDAGADVNAQGGNYGNALQAASYAGDEAAVRLLVEKGAHINAEGGQYGNALQAASYAGQETIVRLLVEKGAHINAQGGRYSTALVAASYAAHEAIVRLLLGKGADIDARSRRYGTALQAASYAGEEALVRLLVEKGADINSQGGLYGNALQAGLTSGVEAVVNLLVEAGANVNAQGGIYGTALQAASWEGDEAVVRLLIDKGADVNVQGGEYGNALQAASWRGDEAVVRLLVDKGANVNAQGGFYDNALQAASAQGNEAVVRLLYDRGAVM